MPYILEILQIFRYNLSLIGLLPFPIINITNNHNSSSNCMEILLCFVHYLQSQQLETPQHYRLLSYDTVIEIHLTA